MELYKTKNDYDCVVPIKGTPEHFYLIDFIKNNLDLNPLAVSYNSQFNSKVGIKNLDLIREIFDIDFIQYTSNPVIYKKLIRQSLSSINSMRWPYIAGEKQFPVQVACEKSIPLIIWPFYQPTEQVGVHSYLEENEMTRRSRHEYDLMGLEPHEMLTVGSLLQRNDIQDITYPSDYLLAKHKIHGIYLDNYLPWDSRKYSEEMIKKYSALSAVNPRTFDPYDRIDDMTYMTIHDVIKQAKYGYSRVTDNLCREIRFGRISKKEAKKIELYYQSQYPKDQIEYFLSWLGMHLDGFKWYLEKMPNYKKLFSSSPDLTDESKRYIDSYIRSGAEVHESNQYIVYGKGINLETPYEEKSQ